ncbi:hypothetical protein [Candidatus Contubernalis alkaliaceticus]|uniref:hypothetical protein n=1 Tax=Candidatus Contubernalis alkaliaceticus TaxID=338645 RepID=UPI001F4C34BE|nr:hypothetical protein [Candidatus Contubernalis alkalaceticus]UNC91767.1 hypothetical protein HUE98_06475 [Candidatus Contubernalis alkalaceticus]
MDIRVLFGFGLGLVLASLLLLIFPPGRMNPGQIEDEARSMGMVYPHEILILNEGEKLETKDKNHFTEDEVTDIPLEETGEN